MKEVPGAALGQVSSSRRPESGPGSARVGMGVAVGATNATDGAADRAVVEVSAEV